MDKFLIVIAVVVLGSRMQNLKSVLRGALDFRVEQESPCGFGSNIGFDNRNAFIVFAALSRLCLSLRTANSRLDVWKETHTGFYYRGSRRKRRLGRRKALWREQLATDPELQAAHKDQTALLNDDIEAAIDAMMRRRVRTRKRHDVLRESREILWIVEQNHDRMSSVNLATAYKGLAMIGKSRPTAAYELHGDKRFDLLIDAVARVGIEKMRAPTVAILLWSFGALNDFPTKTYLPVLTAVLKHLQADTFTVGHLALVVWALGKLETRPTEILPLIQQRVIEHLGESDANIFDCANLIYGFGKLNVQPRELLARACVMMLSCETLDDAAPAQVALIAFGLAYASKPGESDVLLLALAMRATAVIDAFTSKQLIALIFAFTRLRAVDLLVDGEFDTWLDALKDLTRKTELPSVDREFLRTSMQDIGMLAKYEDICGSLESTDEVAEGEGDEEQDIYLGLMGRRGRRTRYT